MKEKEVKEKGFTIVELAVGLLLTSVIVIGIMQVFSTVTSMNQDQKIRLNARLQAEAVLNEIGRNIRSMGNGIPFEQENFDIGETRLSSILPNPADTTVTYPLLIDSSDSNSNKITLRLNTTGQTFTLRSDFDPSLNSSIFLVSSDGLRPSQTVYASNSNLGKEDGSFSIIRPNPTDVNNANNEIRVGNTSIATTGAILEKGSILEPVSTISYEVISGVIHREEDGNDVVMARNANLTFRYLDQNENDIPLTELNLINEIKNIEVEVSVTSDRNTSNGAPYTALINQTFSMRKFNYVY